MRLRMKLRHIEDEKLIPYNYNYFLSSAIYSLLGFGSAEFAEFLHDIGYRVNNKTYKLFTFALRFEKYETSQQGIRLLSPYVYLTVSSPKIDEFFKGILIGSFNEQELKLKIKKDFIHRFIILSVEEIPYPDFFEETKFSLLTPIVLSTMRRYNGKLSQYYFRYNDDIREINRVLNYNLINKYEIINGVKYKGNGINLKWDEKYISAHKTRGVIKKTSLPIKGNTIEIVGNLLPFTLDGDKELMKVGYEAGFGEKNSMGFGMAKVVRN